MSANTKAHISVSTWLVRRNAASSHSWRGASARGVLLGERHERQRAQLPSPRATPPDSVVA